MKEMLNFASDYMDTCRPEILEALANTQGKEYTGYGSDEISERAKEKIRRICNAPEADICFLAGGTQANAFVIDTLLESFEGVICASTGHVNVHEAGAIEFTGHKVMPLPMHDGKISAEDIDTYMQSFESDENNSHMVRPGMVYISQPTEYGTLYSRAELEAIHETCKAHHIYLYVDGARLAYGLAAKKNDVTMADLARLTDVFYIGGTKCGAMIGEAIVIPKHDRIKHLMTHIKQHGALLAKGWVAAIQFDTLFTEDNNGEMLYLTCGKTGVRAADEIRAELQADGYTLYLPNPTNQVFFTIPDDLYHHLCEHARLGFMEKPDADHTIARICTSWATTKEQLEGMKQLLKDARQK